MEKLSATHDQELIALFRGGSQQAFESLYLRYVKQLIRFCNRWLRDENSAEDIAHDVFLQVLEMRADINPEKSFISYLQTIAQNRILNEFKRTEIHLRYARYIITHEDEATNQTENLVLDNDYKKLLNELIEGLTPQQQKVFRLSRIQGLTHKEIAESLQISLPTVKKHATLALESIKKQLPKHLDIDFKTVITLLIFFS